MRSLAPLLLLAAAFHLAGQSIAPHPWGGLVLSEMSALEAAPDFAAWRKMHPEERVKNAAYSVEYESNGLWCADSIADYTFSGGVKAARHAFFYAPSGSLASSLPDHQDTGLVGQCRLFALWYEVRNPADSGKLVQAISSELSAALGAPSEPSGVQRRDGDWGSAYWSPYLRWERASSHIVVAVDPGGPAPISYPGALHRLLIIARSSQAPHGSTFAARRRQSGDGRYRSDGKTVLL